MFVQVEVFSLSRRDSDCTLIVWLLSLIFSYMYAKCWHNETFHCKNLLKFERVYKPVISMHITPSFRLQTHVLIRKQFMSTFLCENIDYLMFYILGTLHWCREKLQSNILKVKVNSKSWHMQFLCTWLDGTSGCLKWRANRFSVKFSSVLCVNKSRMFSKELSWISVITRKE